jgi:AAA domain
MNLTEHESSHLTKLLLIGESGTGKTGSLTSLVKAGYKLRILDLDNGLDVLKMFIGRECPDKMNTVEFYTYRDLKKATYAGSTIPGGPKAFLAVMKCLDKWPDLTAPAEWGSDYILVIDSLSFLSDAAEDWAKTIVPIGKGGQDGRAIVGEAQRAIEAMLSLLTNPAFRTNVIVTAHVQYNDMPDGTKKGQPVAPGVKLGAIIARYFNTTLLLSSTGSRRAMKTVSTGMIDLKNPAPFKIAAELPIETALADVFNAVRSAK